MAVFGAMCVNHSSTMNRLICVCVCMCLRRTHCVLLDRVFFFSFLSSSLCSITVLPLQTLHIYNNKHPHMIHHVFNERSTFYSIHVHNFCVSIRTKMVCSYYHYHIYVCSETIVHKARENERERERDKKKRVHKYKHKLHSIRYSSKWNWKLRTPNEQIKCLKSASKKRHSKMNVMNKKKINNNIYSTQIINKRNEFILIFTNDNDSWNKNDFHLQ